MRHLSDEQLLGELESLKDRERAITLTILRDLGEVERRKLHLTLGYASLFDFATRHLRYSESAAGRRIQAARCIARYPEVGSLLERDEVNLSTIAMVSRILNDANKDELLAAIRNKSQRQVESLVVAAKSATRVRDRSKLVSVPVSPPPASVLAVAPDRPPVPDVPSEQTPSPLGSALIGSPTTQFGDAEGTRGGGAEAAGVQGTDHPRSGSGPTKSCSESVRVEREAVERQFKVQFAVRGECLRKFEEARALLSGRFPKGVPFAEVFEAALDALLEKKSPVRRNARRKQRAARGRQRDASGARGKSEALETPEVREEHEQTGAGQRTKEVASAARRRGRRGRGHIPTAVRDAVFERDGGRCTYAGVNGNRCNSRHDLEVDHRKPLARGGTNAIDNLRLLCARHNLLEAERVYGAEWMQRFR